MDAGENPDIPVIVETLSRPFFPMVRCSYFSVECDDPLPGWSIDLDGNTWPFLMLELVGIIHAPFGASKFTHPSYLNNLFLQIEENAGLLIHFDDIWLPDFLFSHVQKPSIGAVYRLRYELFAAAYRFRDGRQTEEAFLKQVEEHIKGITFSTDETRVFTAWSDEQISTAQKRLAKDPKLKLENR
jgi:hypothetical protein